MDDVKAEPWLESFPSDELVKFAVGRTKFEIDNVEIIEMLGTNIIEYDYEATTKLFREHIPILMYRLSNTVSSRSLHLGECHVMTTKKKAFTKRMQGAILFRINVQPENQKKFLALLAREIIELAKTGTFHSRFMRLEYVDDRAVIRCIMEKPKRVPSTSTWEKAVVRQV
jgi:hypothetical protein